MNFEIPNDIIRGLTDMVWVKAGVYPVKRFLGDGKRVIIIISNTGPRGGPHRQTTIVDSSQGFLSVIEKKHDER